MKIDFNPHAAAQAQKAQVPQPQTTPPAPEVSDGGVEITLSKAAKQLLKGDATYEGNSPAQQARAALLNDAVEFAGGQDASTMPFGQIVKMFAHAKHAPDSTEVAPPDEGGDVGDVPGATEGDGTTVTEGTGGTGDTGTTEGDGTIVTEGTGGTGDTGTTEGDGTIVTEGTGGTGDTGTTEGDGTIVTEGTGTTEGDDTTVVAAPENGDTTVVGDTDPVIVVAEPDITEILDGAEPADGETSETGSGLAGSGDSVASTGDGETNDGATVEDAGVPVAAVDTGDVTDELLELLDETSEEVV